MIPTTIMRPWWPDAAEVGVGGPPAPNRSWERDHDAADPDRYRAEISPKLGDVPLKTIAKATGLSMSTCSLIPQGKRIPHPRHWKALGRIGS